MAAADACAWYRNVLGSPQLVCAPMVRQSELAFRLLTRRLGCQLAFTPMLVASDIVAASDAAPGHSTGDISHQFFATATEDRPLIVQLAGNDPVLLAKAVTLLQHRCEGIDLNLGCPQRCARTGHFGAYLLDTPDRIEEIVRAMVRVACVPISCKIRIQEDIGASVALAKRLEAAGCSMLTVHGRLRSQRHHEGSCNWDAIRHIRQSVSIPVLANGGIESRDHAMECLQYTGCAGVMVASSLLQNPAAMSASSASIYETALQYLALVREFPPLHVDTPRDHVLAMMRTKCQNQFPDLWGVIQHVHSPDQLEACVVHVASRYGHHVHSTLFNDKSLPTFKAIKSNWTTSQPDWANNCDTNFDVWSNTDY
ncbi:hypothetical protein H310_11593 [Aphanomyces invadans]|uniref:tRNA-dihydrouridine(16/17) synthase [NAD(P)(+)] n=1 Tax=Aphanomyces invadans TaxID=157072 RepID=A0A024TLD9_9STRA|nr:hypothetical protein H310_11593 [Aphanomyces invadans]ETV94950.1 hypothetical protein H310_11593 [Aphanomyces invadans]|eukprot:XP_008876541.1 hypothetical protein H310_11593 [Aphanomyces invadans]